MTYELNARYDARKSFYGKARIEETDNEIKLISYSTHVATINRHNGAVTVKGTYSPTTLRHIKEFLKQNGKTAVTKAQIETDYIH